MKNKENLHTAPPPKIPPKPKMNYSVLGRVLKLLVRSYPVLMPWTCVFILLSAAVSSIPSIFTQKVLAVITSYLDAGNCDYSQAWAEIAPLVAVLCTLYVFSLIFITVYTQLMAYITQGFLDKLRTQMFDKMQSLPIRYFDTHKHGDIMSHYTNDIDTLRQLVSQSLPSLLQATVIVMSVFFIMLY